MSNNIHVRRLKWLIGIIGTSCAFAISYLLIMLNIWVAFNVSDTAIATSYTIGFSVGGLACTFLATTFLMLLVHSPIPNIKSIIREANECRALGLLKDNQNNKIQLVCDEALEENKKKLKVEKNNLMKEIENGTQKQISN